VTRIAGIVIVSLLLFVGCDRDAEPRAEPTVFVDVEIATEPPGMGRLPASWAHIAQDGLHSSLGLAASPRAELLDATANGDRVTGLEGRQDLRLDDAYVEVSRTMGSVAGGFEAPPLETSLDLDDFEASQEKVRRADLPL
jgi:hypothetical protein